MQGIRMAAAAVIMTLLGFVLPSCAQTDPVTQPQPGSDEARIQECMQQSSRSVCEMKIIGP